MNGCSLTLLLVPRDVKVDRGVIILIIISNQLVYYWFEGRSRNITNEYMAKWFVFWDSLTRQRTDGALVRLVTFVPEGSDIALADQRLVEFIKDFDPLLPAYIPN